ncbi:hypothetical protein TWF506_004355 [Arthrobotrys conoides]|uniref:Uncharacterized protein n=1 Tax=Arthrobotrys conoides TaxID=74498 RepID=A0AAN8RIB0_9PEZI
MIFRPLFSRKKPAPNGAEDIPPSLALLRWNYRASTETFQWWLPYIQIPAKTAYEGTLKFVGFSIGFTCVWMYILGMIALAAILSNSNVSFERLQAVGFITMFISVSAGTTINAINGEFLWSVKWSLLNHHSFTLEEIQKILDGDSGFQSINNLLVGPNRARILSLYLLLARTGPRIGLAFLASSYEVGYDKGDKLYHSTVNWGYAVGGLILLVVIQSLITIISVFSIRHSSIIPPNTALGLSIALRPCLKPLRDSGGTADTSKIISALKGDSPKYFLQVANIRGASVAQFALSTGSREPIVSSTQQKKLELETKLFFTSTNVLTSPLLPGILSLVAAYIIYGVLVSRYIASRSFFGTSVNFALSTIGQKFLLTILLQLYGLFLGAFADSVLHIVRWGCISSNKTNLTFVESLLVAKNWWNLSSFRLFRRGGWRGRVSKWISALQTRALVTTIGWAVLVAYYEKLAGGNGYWRVAVGALAASFGMVVSMWILCAGTLAHKNLIPEGKSLPKAHAFRKLAAQLEATGSVDKEVRYGRVEAATGGRTAAVSGSAEPFLPGTYL